MVLITGGVEVGVGNTTLRDVDIRTPKLLGVIAADEGKFRKARAWERGAFFVQLAYSVDLSGRVAV